MRKIKILASALCISILFASCGSTATDDFEDINGQEAKKKRLKKITPNVDGEEISATFFYNSDLKLDKIEGAKGNESSVFQYANTGDLINVSGNGANETFDLEVLFEAPYKVMGAGEVVDYDSRNNPSKIIVRQEEYNYVTNTTEMIELVAELVYDESPNLFFGTLEAAGIIDVLDGVKLDLSTAAQSAEVIKARKLLPLNNITKITYKKEGKIVGALDISYNYDSDNYPVKGIGVVSGDNGTNNGTVAVSFSYE